MGLKISSLLVVAVLPATCGAAPPDTHVEFLWAPTPEGAIARQQTLGFLLDGRQHQVCVAVLDADVGTRMLGIEAMDAAGQRVSRQEHRDFRGTKRCYRADLGANGVPGQWTFNIFLDGTLAKTKTIEVAKNLETAPFHAPSLIPYVLGRPNYDPAIPPAEFVGGLVWVMHVDPSGAVTHVEIESAEGVGIRMQDRALAAGYLSLFPPDPSRTGVPATYRRELKFDVDR